MSNTNKEELDQKAIERLQASSNWLITEATGKIYANPDYSNVINHDLIKNFQVALDGIPTLNSDPTILRYMPKSRGIRYDIELLKNATYQNAIYEYWRIFITSDKWATKQSNQCYFLVTKATTQIEKRTIVKTSYQFFHHYKQGEITILTLDYENDLKLRYKLSPWHFKQCFEKYPKITKEKVIVLRDGSYQVIPN